MKMDSYYWVGNGGLDSAGIPGGVSLRLSTGAVEYVFGSLMGLLVVSKGGGMRSDYRCLANQYPV
jgi:hypothetical protein